MTATTGTLKAAADYLGAAVAELDAFAELHPERLDASIAQATDMASAALDCIDSDFYVENEAKPEEGPTS